MRTDWTHLIISACATSEYYVQNGCLYGHFSGGRATLGGHLSRKFSPGNTVLVIKHNSENSVMNLKASGRSKYTLLT